MSKIRSKFCTNCFVVNTHL